MRSVLMLFVLVCVFVCTGCAGRCISGDCSDGYRTFMYKDGKEYTGYVSNGKANGQGTLKFPTGENYVGGFKDGEFHGQGAATLVNGDKYVGEFLDSKFSGDGTYFWPDGRKYVGKWLDGKTNGQGLLTWPNGASYEGVFQSGKITTGNWANAVGDKYTGEFVDGQFGGQGVYAWSNGRSYVGKFLKGNLNGLGTFSWPDGRKHFGEWKDGKRVGQGTATYANGQSLSGLWADSIAIVDISARDFAALLPVGAEHDQFGILEKLATERQTINAEKAQLEKQKAELEALQKSPKQASKRPKASMTDARRTALVIGNSAYLKGPLKNPANDAHDMAASLKNLGFDVTVLIDATQQQMEHATREFGAKLRQGGVGLFYYAGHGVQVGGENFLVPVNAVIQSEGDVKYGSVNAGLVLAKMEDAGNGLNIVILDACRSNPYARSFRTANEGLAKMDAPTGSLISYATAPGSVASDGTGRNGVFTRHLLENMKAPGLPISEVLMRVRQGVVKETAKKQVPWEASSLIGQFYFSE